MGTNVSTTYVTCPADPNKTLGSAGQVTYVVLTFVPMISSTLDWMSVSVRRLMCPFLTFLSQICNGLLPIE